ncbi:AAA family ATPase [uncultured Mucilaginibacter sp.]|uniref:AAA family ATPase n=1 Tax=uncultured Mucilaginibacter sp. TaxID=797541 RepID=UPI0025E40407|nr:AAA family ATPase [uncultured Mucilaginibacter sp.]
MSTRPPIIEIMRNAIRDTTPREREKNALLSQLRNDPSRELFYFKPADLWLKEESKPAARQLLGTLWYEHELCILFADTNLGKSVLAVQIGDHLAKQTAMEPFGSELNEALKVLYLDFELSATQFKARYNDSRWGPHHFGGNFIRAEFNPGGDDPLLYNKYEDYVKERIEFILACTKAQVLIIDNITYMGNPLVHGGSALQLIKTLKAIKTKYKLSVLVLAHTPKRNACKPITVNDLQGSKMLINFADSAFALGQSHSQPQLRYLKQIKQRNAAAQYDAAHVCLFSMVKTQNFLGMQFQGFDHEQFHLQKAGAAISPEVKQRIPGLAGQGLSVRQIADHLRIGSSTVQRVLAKLKEGDENEGD